MSRVLPIRMLVRTAAAALLLSRCAWAQFFSYEEVEAARRRAEDAERLFLIGAVLVGIVFAVLILRIIVHFRSRIKPNSVADATTGPPAWFFGTVLQVLSFGSTLIAVLV